MYLFRHYPKRYNMFNIASMNIILASQSPRRLTLLQAAGYKVNVCPSHINEVAKAGESTQEMTLRLCKEKAEAYAFSSDEAVVPVIAADTLVAAGDEALGQPKDLIEAKVMIQKLSGKQHQVHTAVCVRVGDVYKTSVVTTSVSFREITGEEIDVYLRHNDILDKAGAYAIQGGASSFIVAMDGPLDNVIGLPILQTKSLLRDAMAEAGQQAKELMVGI